MCVFLCHLSQEFYAIGHHNIVKSTQMVTALAINYMIFFVWEELPHKKTQQVRRQKSLARLKS